MAVHHDRHEPRPYRFYALGDLRRGKLVGLGIHDLDAMTSPPNEGGDESGPDWVLDSSQSPAQRLVDGSARTRVDQDQIDALSVDHGTRNSCWKGF